MKQFAAFVFFFLPWTGIVVLSLAAPLTSKSTYTGTRSVNRAAANTATLPARDTLKNQRSVRDTYPLDDEPKRYAVRPVSFNSPQSDFSPFPYRDGLVFVSSRPSKNSAKAEDVFFNLFVTAESEDGSFSPPELLNSEGNSVFHDGPAIFYDGERRKIFTRNAVIKKGKAKEGAIRPLELAWSEVSASGKWSEPVAIPLASQEFSVAHPAISSDGKTLFFSSNMPGTLGESDLFVSRFEDGSWSAPKNLGSRINTPGQELFPHLFNDSILYFSSSGRPGMGGLDIFFCNLNQAVLTVKPVDAPINSEQDDFGIFLESGGNSGFFSSNRQGGLGEDDIYFFEEIQSFIQIEIYDSLTRNFVANASVTLYRDGVIKGKTVSDLMGKAEFRLRPTDHYEVHISSVGYTAAKKDLAPALGRSANMKIYLIPFKVSAEEGLTHGLRVRERSNLTNVISFSSSPLDVDLATELPDAAVDTAGIKQEGDSLSLPGIKVFAVEVVNGLPEILFVRNDSIHTCRLVGESLLANDELNLFIDIPKGAKRHDYEEVISQQVIAQGYAVMRFLLIRSFFFDSNKAWVRNDASAQLDKIIEIMFNYPQLNVQMTFHSDARGTEAFNLGLSERRSEEVKAYLVKGGVNPRRIVSKFVGEGQLLNDCGDLSDCDELLHQINRTVEFKFIMRQEK